MDVREKLVEIIQNSVGGCARNWAEIIADGLIANGVTVQQWISVKDRLPEVGDDVIVAVFDGYGADTIIDSIMNDGKWCCSRGNQKVTHWQPMPKTPKGE